MLSKIYCMKPFPRLLTTLTHPSIMPGQNLDLSVNRTVCRFKMSLQWNMYTRSSWSILPSWSLQRTVCTETLTKKALWRWTAVENRPCPAFMIKNRSSDAVVPLFLPNAYWMVYNVANILVKLWWWKYGLHRRPHLTACSPLLCHPYGPPHLYCSQMPPYVSVCHVDVIIVNNNDI